MVFGIKRFLLLVIFLGWGGATSALALTQWEVAVLFLGSKENADYQKDIDRNILELSRSHPNDYYHLSIYRELAKRNVEYFVDPRSPKLGTWDSLFETPPNGSLKVPGEIRTWVRRPDEGNLLAEPVLLGTFLAQAFKIPNSKRILILYSHGVGYEGLGGGVSLKILRKNLDDALPKRPGRPLDILWLDACFMANIETAFELKRTSRILVASEEAEFSAGAPFDMLHSLSWGPDHPYGVALDLAQRFIESYSYIKKGSKHKAIFKSSATISVIDLARLEKLVDQIKQLALALKVFSPEQRQALKIYLQRLTMDKHELIDFGSLILFLSKSNSFQDLKIQEAVTQIRFLLDLQRPEKFQTNPRLLIQPNANSASMAFGYTDWSKGYRGDSYSLEKIPETLKDNVVDFVRGPFEKEWPYRNVKDVLYFSPFSVGLNRFHYYFADTKTAKPVSGIATFQRTKDFVYFPGETAGNPVLFSGYTQGIGENAERYSGLSILDPTVGLPNFDYADLDFTAATGWGNF